MSEQSPLCPRYRPDSGHAATSESCHKQSFAIAPLCLQATKPPPSPTHSLSRNPPAIGAGPSPAGCLFNHEYVLIARPTSLLVAQYAGIRHRLKNAKHPGWRHSTAAVGAGAFIPEALAHELPGRLFQLAGVGGEHIRAMGGHNPRPPSQRDLSK